MSPTARAMARWIGEIDRAQPIDLVIANAGIGVGATDGFETESRPAASSASITRRLHTRAAADPKLTARRAVNRAGEFAGVVPRFPGSPTYCGGKAALRVWGEGLAATSSLRWLESASSARLRRKPHHRRNEFQCHS
jgi:short-subunit dehydrogenase